MSHSILIAGIGNIFNRDDGFGVSVAWKLAAEETMPENVRVVDFGIRGFDLVLALLDSYDLTIFVDVVTRGGPPGTLYLIKSDSDGQVHARESGVIDSAHGLDPCKVLAIAYSLGAPAGTVVVVGCEPETLGDDTGLIGLSRAVEAAVDPAIEMIRSLVSQFSEDRIDGLRSERIA